MIILTFRDIFWGKISNFVMRHLLKNTLFPFFMTIFELFVLDSFLLKLHHYQLHSQVRSHPYYNFRTQILKYSDSICKEYPIFDWDICWKKKHCSHLFFPNFIWLLDALGPKDQFKTPNSMGFQLLKKKKLKKNFFDKEKF